eukprot:Gb_26614 [translate_table: standard]
MGISGRLSAFCLNKIATHARSPSKAKPIAGGSRSSRASVGNAFETDSGELDDSGPVHKEESWAKSDANSAISRKIMIVVDSSPEAKRALLWALSHTVQDQDTVVLLHVVRPSKSPLKPGSESPHQGRSEEPKRQIDLKDYEVPNALKTICNSRRPEVEVEVIVVEGKEKGPAIVSQAKKQAASLLILGQRKPSLLWRLLITWAGAKNSEGAGVVEYCIQNAECMTLAVRRKSRRVGGYLISTRRQKNFWLLA